jgi:hypothetical protein
MWERLLRLASAQPVATAILLFTAWLVALSLTVHP